MKQTVQNLYFNILTFDWPDEPQTFYFSRDYKPGSTPIYRSLFPTNIELLFPGIGKENPDFIYTNFQIPRDGFEPLQINLKDENEDLVKRILSNNIHWYFRNVMKELCELGFIRENKIWIPVPELSTPDIETYNRFSLKIQIGKVSSFPEIVLSYDGLSHVLRRSLAEVIPVVGTQDIHKLLFNNRIHHYNDFTKRHLDDYKRALPFINRGLERSLGLELPSRHAYNKYREYQTQIQQFYERFLNNDTFRQLIKLHADPFLRIPSELVDRTCDESSKLLFGKNGTSMNPYEGIKNFGPYSPGKHNKVHLFYIFHEQDTQTALTINQYFRNGLKWFKGIQEFAHILAFNEPGFSIKFKDRNNPVPEIEKELAKREFEPGVKYLAIYLTPISPTEKDIKKKRVYFEVKELLLKRNISSQVMDPSKVQDKGEDYTFSLPNLAIAMLAKLDGVPWSLTASKRNELVVGVGAFRQRSTGMQYIGSSFCFDNKGKFNRFDCFLKNELDLLVGSIAKAVRNYVESNNSIERLIIHFYKKMSHRELQPIEDALKTLGLDIPVFIVSINKTESRNIVAFDEYDPDLMPYSGTYLNIDTNRYLLFNNTRYVSDPLAEVEGFPFPVKLSIDCNRKELLNDYKTIQDLINQVYQFSRLYWKSMKQQNLPITVKYPEMLARMAPNFVGEELPVYGKEGLWFL